MACRIKQHNTKTESELPEISPYVSRRSQHFVSPFTSLLLFHFPWSWCSPSSKMSFPKLVYWSQDKNRGHWGFMSHTKCCKWCWGTFLGPLLTPGLSTNSWLKTPNKYLPKGRTYVTGAWWRLGLSHSVIWTIFFFLSRTFIVHQSELILLFIDLKRMRFSPENTKHTV